MRLRECFSEGERVPGPVSKGLGLSFRDKSEKQMQVLKVCVNDEPDLRFSSLNVRETHTRLCRIQGNLSFKPEVVLTSFFTWHTVPETRHPKPSKVSLKAAKGRRPVSCSHTWIMAKKLKRKQFKSREQHEKIFRGKILKEVQRTVSAQGLRNLHNL